MSERLEALANIHYGKSPNDVATDEGSIPIVGTGGIYGRSIRPMFDSGIVVARKGSLGKPHLFKTPFWAVDTTYAVVPKPGVNIDWLYYCLSNFDLTKLNEATGVPSINRNWLARITFPTPGTEQQKRIAQVLSGIDTTITQTEALIAKYQHIKAGLMHDLFTRGVLPNGQLRPPREQAPGLYRETVVGWIPVDWTLEQLDQVADVIDPNPSHRNPIYHPEGFPFISTVEFIDNDKVETNTPRRVIEDIVAEQEARCRFSEHSIGFSRKGTIGEIRFLPGALRFALLDSLCVINARRVSPVFLFHSLRSEAVIRQSKNMTMGQALPQVSIGRVRELQIPTPPEVEQSTIGERMTVLMNAIERQSASLAKLKQQKLGLMQDLLTGKVSAPANN